MELERLRSFLRVAEAGSLTRACAAANTAQSTLTRHIAELERELGGRLFHRTGRGVVLTELGELVLPRFRWMVAEMDQVAADLRARSRSPTGLVTLGMLASVAELILPTLLGRVRAQFPGIRIRVQEGFSVQVEEWLARGEVDIGVFNTTRRRGPEGARRLFEAILALVGPAGGEPLSPEVPAEALAGRDLILPGPANNVRRLVQESCARRDIELNVVLELDSVRAIKALVAAGLGWTVLPEHAVAVEVKERRLQAARLVRPRLSQTIVIAATRQRPPGLAAREIERLVHQAVWEARGRG